MPQYDNYSGSGTGSSNGDNNYDDITLKVQEYSSIRGTLDRVGAFNGNYGDKFIAGWEGVVVTDGIVFQRDDNPDTWKVFSFGALGFDITEDGRVVEDADSAGDNDGLTAQEILDHARIRGFSETFGGDTYWYTPVGVVIDGQDDAAVNDEEVDVSLNDDGEIAVGDVSMLLSNKSWVRTLAKLTTAQAKDIIETTTNEQGNTVSVNDSFGWLTTLDPDIRDTMEGREMDMFIIEESFTPEGSDDEISYYTPVLLDSKTGERVTLNNDEEDSEDTQADADAEPAVADGGTTTETTEDTDTASPETTDSPDTSGGLPEDVPKVLDDVIGYFARNEGEDTEADELRAFAADEVDSTEDVDWEAAAAEARSRA